MIYAMSDLHGEYAKFLRMLEQIGFTSDDTLYILGDIVDRGPEPISLIRDLSCRFNVYPVLGNHEYMALTLLRKLAVPILEENYRTHLDADTLRGLSLWLKDGGRTTLDQFRALDTQNREAVLEYLEEMSLYETVRAGGRSFVLVHSGLVNFSPERPLDSYRPEELIFARPDLNQPYFADRTVVCGHTPTQAVTGRSEVCQGAGSILIDCGACYEGGRLACLRLDDLETFYI